MFDRFTAFGCLLLIGGLIISSVWAQPPVCSENRYGNAAQAALIEQQMQTGTVADVTEAIAAAQRTRGLDLGCAELSYGYAGTSTEEPTSARIRSAWAVHAASASQATATYDRCPATGRAAGAYMLGGWLARSGGLEFSSEPLAAIANNLQATQYRSERTPGRQPTWPGMFAYARALGQTDSGCYVPGVVGQSVAMACTAAPQLCVSYDSGRFAGMQFVVGDYLADLSLRDGGGAFDQGWAGVAMVEAALGTTDPQQRERFKSAAIAAGDWALAEPPVRNHNYTAKLIWLLAVLYDWTGEPRFRLGLIDKLERNLLPGVLMDSDSDGRIDSAPHLRFADLRAPAARVPGRMWDAHNALPWYQAMNTWAMVEAYAAFRSRDDHLWSQKLRPYALAMVDNLAAELAPSGGLPPIGPGSTQIGYAFATAMWKIADVEGLDRPQWTQSLWASWNSGLGSAPGDNKTATAAIVALRERGYRYRSYAARELALASTLPTDSRISGAWYNPERSGEGLFVLAIATDRLLVSWYTYDPVDPSRQVWLLADGSFDGQRFDGEAVITAGTRFGSLFDTNDVERRPWGVLSLQFENCQRALFSWQSEQPGYANGAYPVLQLAGTTGLSCAP